MILILTNIQPERTFETKLKEFCSVDRSFPFNVDMGCIVMVVSSIVEHFECQTLLKTWIQNRLILFELLDI